MKGEFDLHDYSDIIDLPHHVSPNRRRMSSAERGAQFSPFAALTGYEAAVEEAARLTDEKRELSEEMKSVIDAKLQLLSDTIAGDRTVTVIHFVPDARKSGGKYVSTVGAVMRVDASLGCIIMSDGKRIAIENIRDIDGDIFGNFEY